MLVWRGQADVRVVLSLNGLNVELIVLYNWCRSDFFMNTLHK